MPEAMQFTHETHGNLTKHARFPIYSAKPGFRSALLTASPNWAAISRQLPKLGMGYPVRDARAAGFQSKEATMATGTVKFFNAQKGFGFIQPTDGSKDVFVHISAVEKAGMGTLNEGQQVSYDVVTERGKQAAGNLKPA